MSEKCRKQKCSTAIASSQLVQARQPGGQERKRPKDVKLSIYSGHLSSMESVEHKKERLEPLFFAFIGKDATCFAAQLERAAKVMQPERNDPNVRMRQERASKFAFNPTTWRGPVRVKSVILSVGGSLPVCTQLRTFSAPVGMSQRCQLPTQRSKSPFVPAQISQCGCGNLPIAFARERCASTQACR
jgi:hypothetical protein